jgi:DNA-binding MarR family transcriptional regulator
MQNYHLESSTSKFTTKKALSTNLINPNRTNNTTNFSLATFTSFVETKSYNTISNCVLEHILTATHFTNHEKLYYLLADSLSLINKNKSGDRHYALPSEDWATRLGCSRSLVFTMQKSLEDKGYFIINKELDDKGRNKRNLIKPTLPDAVFNHLNQNFPDVEKDHTPYNPSNECKRLYLDRTKLFIKLNYNLLKIITSNKYIKARQKIMWLGFYNICYKNYIFQSSKGFNSGKYSYNNDCSFSFISSYKELADLYSCNAKDISKSIRALEASGFIKTENVHVRKQANCQIQERQDTSLWKITLMLPDYCISELNKVKDRILKVKNTQDELTIAENNIDPKAMQDCLTLGGIKFNLNLEQSLLLKTLIVADKIDITESHIDSVMEELDIGDTEHEQSIIEVLTSASKNKDPHVAKSGLLLNKDLKSKANKSNLGTTSKVLLNKFLKKLKRDKKEEQFNICSELIRKKLNQLPKDKADKARRFAYTIFTKGLALGYAATLNKHELVKQLIHHAASWKPTKFGSISREKEIDTALSVAWKAIINGTWKAPLELAKAEILQYEFIYYQQKYIRDGILSEEIRNLEKATNSLLGMNYDLTSRITEANINKRDDGSDSLVIAYEEESKAIVASSNRDTNIELPSFRRDQECYLSYNDLISCANQIIDLSDLSEKQKYLKLSYTEIDDELIIKTIDDTQYLYKLKTMEVNGEGEMIMTLKNVPLKTFVQEANDLMFKNQRSNTSIDNVLSGF